MHADELDSTSPLHARQHTRRTSDVDKRADVITAAGAPLPDQRQGDCRLVILSDTHGQHDACIVPLGDVLIHLGDIADRGSLGDIRSFAEWLQRQPHAEKVVIEGNHDRDLLNPGRIDLERELGRSARVLRDETIVVANGRLSVHGASWMTCEENAFERTLAQAIAANAPPDVLLTHVPPLVDTGTGSKVGSELLRRVVESLCVPLHLFGHWHIGRGVSTGATTYVNCATLKSAAVVIDWDPRERRVRFVHCSRHNMQSRFASISSRAQL